MPDAKRPHPEQQPTLDDLALRQQGCLTTGQLQAANLGRGTIVGLVQRGLLVRVRHGVYRLAGTSRNYRQSVMAAVLAAGDGAVVSHRSAAALHGLIGSSVSEKGPAPPLELSVPRSHSGQLADVSLHRCRTLLDHHVRRSAIPVTTPARTLVDLASVTKIGQLTRWTTTLLQRRHTTAGAIRTVISDLHPSGRNGLGGAADALRRATADDRAPNISALERLARKVLTEGGLEPTGFEVNIIGAAGWIGRVDATFAPERVIAEFDGGPWHDPATDAARDRDMLRAGWLTVRYTWFDLARRREVTVTELRSTLAGRLALTCNQAPQHNQVG